MSSKLLDGLAAAGRCAGADGARGA
ncbi:MAG: hypothetical protein RL018_113, partial [Pseudomonadota bacterium]